MWNNKYEHDQVLEQLHFLKLKKSDFIKQSNESVLKEYVFGKSLGKGAFGVVYRVFHKGT